jgi:hypothetical protein
VARCLYLRSDDRTPPNPTPNRAIEIYGFVSPDTQSLKSRTAHGRQMRPPCSRDLNAERFRLPAMTGPFA